MKLLNWFKQLFVKKILFSLQIMRDKKVSNPKLYVNRHGKLVFKDEIFNHYVIGLTEWGNFEKNFFKIPKNTTVIDILITKPINEINT